MTLPDRTCAYTVFIKRFISAGQWRNESYLQKALLPFEIVADAEGIID